MSDQPVQRLGRFLPQLVFPRQHPPVVRLPDRVTICVDRLEPRAHPISEHHVFGALSKLLRDLLAGKGGK